MPVPLGAPVHTSLHRVGSNDLIHVRRTADDNWKASYDFDKYHLRFRSGSIRRRYVKYGCSSMFLRRHFPVELCLITKVPLSIGGKSVLSEVRPRGDYRLSTSMKARLLALLPRELRGKAGRRFRYQAVQRYRCSVKTVNGVL